MIPELDRASRAALRRYLNLGPRDSLRSALVRHTYGPADVCLALLRCGLIAQAEAVAGVRLRRLPPDPRLRPSLARPTVAERGSNPDPVVTRVGPNPRLPTTDAYQRYRRIAVGMTVSQLLRRGVTRRDLRELSRAGHVELAS